LLRTFGILIQYTQNLNPGECPHIKQHDAVIFVKKQSFISKKGPLSDITKVASKSWDFPYQQYQSVQNSKSTYHNGAKTSQNINANGLHGVGQVAPDLGGQVVGVVSHGLPVISSCCHLTPSHHSRSLR